MIYFVLFDVLAKEDLGQGWGQIRFIKYKYKYKNLDFSNTNTNTNIFFNFDSNTNTNINTSIQIQIQIQICSTKYICRNCSGSKIGQFYKSQDKCSLACVSLCLGDTWSLPLCISGNFIGTRAVGVGVEVEVGVGVLSCWIGIPPVLKYKGRTWWSHQMEIFFALLVLCVGNSPVTGEIPSQRPLMRTFDVFFDLCLNKRLSKQS